MEKSLSQLSFLKTSSTPTFKKNSSVLCSLESATDISWNIERVFFISSEFAEDRGDHAHRTCKQLFVCVSGEVKIICKDGITESEFTLTGLGNNLYVPPGIWVNIRMESKTSLAVITDHIYDELDYIRNWDDFLSFRETE